MTVMQQVGWIKDVNAFSDCRKVFAALAVAIVAEPDRGMQSNQTDEVIW